MKCEHPIQRAWLSLCKSRNNVEEQNFDLGGRDTQDKTFIFHSVAVHSRINEFGASSSVNGETAHFLHHFLFSVIYFDLV
jgi:hypothetical protein